MNPGRLEGLTDVTEGLLSLRWILVLFGVAAILKGAGYFVRQLRLLVRSGSVLVNGAQSVREWISSALTLKHAPEIPWVEQRFIPGLCAVGSVGASLIYLVIGVSLFGLLLDAQGTLTLSQIGWSAALGTLFTLVGRFYLGLFWQAFAQLRLSRS